MRRLAALLLPLAILALAQAASAQVAPVRVATTSLVITSIYRLGPYHILAAGYEASAPSILGALVVPINSSGKVVSISVPVTAVAETPVATIVGEAGGAIQLYYPANGSLSGKLYVYCPPGATPTIVIPVYDGRGHVVIVAVTNGRLFACKYSADLTSLVSYTELTLPMSGPEYYATYRVVGAAYANGFLLVALRRSTYGQPYAPTPYLLVAYNASTWGIAWVRDVELAAQWQVYYNPSSPAANPALLVVNCSGGACNYTLYSGSLTKSYPLVSSGVPCTGSASLYTARLLCSGSTCSSVELTPIRGGRSIVLELPRSYLLAGYAALREGEVAIRNITACYFDGSAAALALAVEENVHGELKSYSEVVIYGSQAPTAVPVAGSTTPLPVPTLNFSSVPPVEIAPSPPAAAAPVAVAAAPLAVTVAALGGVAAALAAPLVFALTRDSLRAISVAAAVAVAAIAAAFVGSLLGWW